MVNEETHTSLYYPKQTNQRSSLRQTLPFLCEFTQIIACHGLLGYPYIKNIIYPLGTEKQHTLAQFLHIILYFKQNNSTRIQQHQR